MHLEHVPDRAYVDAVPQLLVGLGVGLTGKGELIREPLKTGGLPRCQPAMSFPDDTGLRDGDKRGNVGGGLRAQA